MSTLKNGSIAPYLIAKGEQTVSFLGTGDLFEHLNGPVMLNLYRPDHLYGSISNIWLRLYEDESMTVYPLIGRGADQSTYVLDDRVIYEGTAGNIDYRVTFALGEHNTTFMKVDLEGDSISYDLLLGKDLGLADKGAVLTNELYGAQYIDYQVYGDVNGHHICARQNMSQGGRHPYFQLGMLEGESVEFATDGLKLFSLEYRRTNEPAMLKKDLDSEIIQGEFSYLALQTAKSRLDGEASVVFYGYFEPTLDTAIEGLRGLDDVRQAYDSLRLGQEDTSQLQAIPQATLNPELGKPYNSPEFNSDQIADLYPHQDLVETDEETMLSFFTPEHEHVVTQAKETMVERAHGHIVTTFLDLERVSPNLLTSTSYMYGLFHSQTVIGNTSMNKFLSTNRGFLNQSKMSGQRVYVRIDGVYRMLQLPALYEVGMGHSRWYYNMPENDTLVVTAFAVVDRTQMVLDIRSQSGRAYDLCIGHQLVLGEHEFTNSVQMDELEDGKILSFRPEEPGEYYPELNYTIQTTGAHFRTGDDGIFFDDGKTRNSSYLTLHFEAESHVQIVITGELEESGIHPRLSEDIDFAKNRLAYLDSYSKAVRAFHIEPPEKASATLQEDAAVINHTVWWYAHNALVHFAVPHGLEQSGGAAWGTRDVCQGPMEFFYTFQHYELARDVLLTLFSHQQEESREWPQWFMFDKFPYNAGDCHGDVVFWPLKTLSEYLEYTGDYGILEECVPYQSANGTLTEKKSSMLDHLKVAFEAIQDRFLDDTHLISFAGGDWNDTLQPAAEDLRDKLISTWTQALAYQSISQLGQVLTEADHEFAEKLRSTAEKIREDFIQYLVKDGVVSGLAMVEDDGIKMLLHPEDDITGISYRMLPMTRSIIASMVDEDQAERSMTIIKDHLLFPDGAHLMNRPPRYHGGVTELFVRAEQATYIGRELSLMYTHAHLRYMEALAALGRGEEAWRMSFVVNPMSVEREAPHATKRQRNLYYSSSEGDFTSRADFAENFDKLRDGSIPVKGGWRLYSSGPGIYLHQVITNILGIQVKANEIEIMPAIPAELAGLRLTMDCFGRAVDYVYEYSRDRLVAESEDGTQIGTYQASGVGRPSLIISRDEVITEGVITIKIPSREEA